MLDLWDGGQSLASLMWAQEVQGPVPGSLSALPATTPQSRALSAELRRRGFRFVGPTTLYAAMQSLGVVNDHLAGCHFRALVEDERSRFVRPL